MILPKGYMNYIFDVIDIAAKMGSKFILNTTPERKFYVVIENVFVRDGYRPKPIQGLGTNISDACQDYLRQIRGEKLWNVMSNKEEVFV